MLISLIASNDEVDNRRTLCALVVFSLIGAGSLCVGPVVVGQLVDRLGFTEAQAGYVYSVEAAGLALGSLLVVFGVNRVDRRGLALAGTALVVLGNALSLGFVTVEPLLLARLIAGIGAGFANAAVFATAAGSRRPDALYGLAVGGTFFYGAVLLFASPWIVGDAGISGIFGLLAFFAVLSIPFLRWLPRYAVPIIVSGQRAEKPISKMPIVVLLAALTLVLGGSGSVWAFQERIGVEAGLDPQAIGMTLGWSMIVGSVMSAAAKPLGLRIGRSWPLVIGLGGCALVNGAFAYADTPLRYVVISQFLLLWSFGMAYIFGLLAVLDRGGRASTLGWIAVQIGSTFGPMLASGLIDAIGRRGVVLLAAGQFALAMLLALPVAAIVSRRIAAGE